MRKVYYIYNPKTRTYDRIYPTVRQRALSYLRQLFVGMGLGAGSGGRQFYPVVVDFRFSFGKRPSYGKFPTFVAICHSVFSFR